MLRYSTVSVALISRLRLISIAILIWVIGYNLWGLANHPMALPSPGTIDAVVVRENDFGPIHEALDKEGYRSGFIDYLSTRTLRGEPRSAEDDFRLGTYRFAASPLILSGNAPDAPYVLGDFTEDGVIPPTPQGLSLVANPGKGLVLYKRKPKP